MIELYKRCWQIFYPLFAVFLLGSLQAYIYLNNNPHQCLIIVILLLLSALAFIIATFAFVTDFRDAKKKERESKTKDGRPRLV